MIKLYQAERDVRLLYLHDLTVYARTRLLQWQTKGQANLAPPARDAIIVIPPFPV